ncbi:hypothetical protein [Ruminococcus flavefaciens]|uniref:DUF7577 domain-containing protein n=1 Tax=Ruminococcus flavefaciens TaxID=1265 RepID=UPI0026F1CF29|nr:hypothetical protein [Ruminococcus flavefaciens]
MKCPQCGTVNEAGFRFCVKCGVNLENPQDINIEQVDMGGYHSEEDSASGGFTLGSGTFTISDTPSRDSSSDLYTAAELNDTDEEFDFSSIDEPFIPHLDTGRVTLPEQTKAVRQAQMQNAGLRPQGGMAGIPPQQAMMQGLSPQGAMAGIPPQQGMMQGLPTQGAMAGIPPQQGMMQGLPPQGAMAGIPPQQGMMQGIPPQGAMAGIPPQQGMMQGIPPQAGGAQMNGMPVYGQPMMYAQPQIIGYDQNGMPLYGQPMMYAQPQMLGYDQNGMPVYGQPVMFAQPQIIGYDQNGMPVYGQPVMYAQPQNTENTEPKPEAVAPPVEDKDKVEVPDDFWEFFDGGKATEHAEMDSADDFFGKRGDEIEGMKRFEKKNQAYMNDTPLVDASALKKNESDKYNKYFMRSAGTANADDLMAKQESLHLNYMGATKNVDASELRAKEERKAWNIMGAAKQANADDLEANSQTRAESIMAQADHAVEAMPKRAKTYNDEIDAIELPEEMKAKKTNNIAEIPGLPEF